MDSFYSYYTICGIFLVILCLILKYCYKNFKIYSKFPILHALPIMINYHIARKSSKAIPFSGFVLQNLIEKCRKYTEEGIVLTYILRPILVIFGEEAIKVFSNEKIAGDKPREYSVLEQMFGPGLISSNGERWRKHRKMLNPAFQLGMLKERVPLFNEHASALVKDMESLVDSPSSEPLDLIKHHYFSALSESVFGLKQCEENKAENLRYFQMIDDLASSGIYRLAHPYFQWKIFRYILPSERKWNQMKNELFFFTKKVITEMEKLISSSMTSNSQYFGKNMQKSLTYILLQHHLNDPSFTFEDLHAEVTTFMAAGYDTVSYTTMWCLFMLGLYPEVQEKAFNEVNSVPHDYITYEDSCKFTYLESVIMETLRLYPTIPFFGRDTSQDVQLGKYFIPKGTNIAFFPYLLHRNSEIYPDPEKFNPERFSVNAVRNTWTHIPFAEGNRTCIGRKYALIEMKIFLAYILRNFKIISLDRREDIVLCWNVILTPAKPLRMRILPRFS